jgi:hypothetical protein
MEPTRAVPALVATEERLLAAVWRAFAAEVVVKTAPKVVTESAMVAIDMTANLARMEKRILLCTIDILSKYQFAMLEYVREN